MIELFFLLSFLLVCLFVISSTFLYWIKSRQSYFKKVGIPYVPSSLILGSFSDVFLKKICFFDQVVALYNHPDVKNKPFFGFFLLHTPGLMVTDPELIKRITVKDFNSFSNRYTASDIHDPIGYYSLFSANGQIWKTLRGKMSPFFGCAKLKSMYYLVDKDSSNMIEVLEKSLDEETKVECEVKELASLYATDVIATCAFGIEVKSLDNPHGEIRTIGKTVFGTQFLRSLEFASGLCCRKS